MFNVTRQAYIYTIITIVTTFINLILSGVLFGINGFFTYLVIFVFLIPLILLSIYNIDCLSTGNCEIWAWINSILGIIYMIATTLIMIAAAVVKPDVSKDTKDTKDSMQPANSAKVN